MATYTLTQDENWSDIKASISNNDDVALAGYTLTLDEEPTLTGINVTTTGTAGLVVISGAYDLSTWTFTAGTDAIIETIPEGCEVGAVTGGSANGANGCDTNNGTITTATGGSAYGAKGCDTNNGTIATATASSVTNGAHGCARNYGTITTCAAAGNASSYGCYSNFGTITTLTGGSTNLTHGCYRNYHTIVTCSGGTSGGAHGCYENNGTIEDAWAGGHSNYGCYANYGLILTAHGKSGGYSGCEYNYGQILAADDEDGNAGSAINKTYGSVKFVDGPNFKTEIETDSSYDPLQTLYILNGPLSEDATVPEGVEQIELFNLSSGGGTPVFGGMVQRRA